MNRALVIILVALSGALLASASVEAENATGRSASELASALATEMSGDQTEKLQAALEARGLSAIDAHSIAEESTERIYGCFLNAAIALDEERGGSPGALLERLWQSYESDAPVADTFSVLEGDDLFLAGERAELCMLNVAQELGVMDLLD